MSLPMHLVRSVLTAATLALAVPALARHDPLASWNDGDAKAATLDFVTAVTDPASADFVPVPERIATFDNDGMLWVEAPIYTQITFALGRIKMMAPDHPEWKDNPVLKAAMDGDMEALAKSGMKGVGEIVMTTHAGMTSDDYAQTVSDWVATAKHPKFDRHCTDLTCQPMKDLIRYLQDNGFKTYIVSGGGVESMRPWTEGVDGILPVQVIGSSVETTFEMQDGKPVLMRQPEFFFVDDKDGQAVGIQKFIGRRPIASFGKADGDIPMLQWTLAGDGRRLGMLVHLTDGDREYAYDRKSHGGTLGKGIDDAGIDGWQLIDIKQDWETVFSPSQ